MNWLPNLCEKRKPRIIPLPHQIISDLGEICQLSNATQFVESRLDLIWQMSVDNYRNLCLHKKGLGTYHSPEFQGFTRGAKLNNLGVILSFFTPSYPYLSLFNLQW